MEILGIYIDPVALSVLAGVIWPLLQAMIDQPRWSAHTRRVIVIVAGAALTAVVWLASAFPVHWDAIATMITGFIGAATTAFTLLKRAGLIDWIGRVTPGGEPRHRLDPPTPTASEPVHGRRLRRERRPR